MLPSLSIKHQRATDVDFRREITQAVSQLPRAVSERLDQHRVQIKTGVRVVDVFPDLRGVRPRGADPGVTWEHVAAGYDPHARIIVIGERIDVVGTSLSVVADNPAGALRHEVGHAWDELAFDAGPIRSSIAFMQAWQADIADLKRKLSSDEREQLRYYLVGNDDDVRQEIAAESFAIVVGGGSDRYREELFRRAFRQTLAVVRTTVLQARK